MTSFDGQSHPILCIEYEDNCLYGELIQVISQRNLYWLRPFVLCSAMWSGSEPTLYDLRQGADLLCPQALCRPAMDIEILPVLIQLENFKAEPDQHFIEADRTAHQKLQAFIRQLGQAYPDVFQQAS